MLLNVVKGPQSYKDLKTVNERVCESFKEACYAYGLLNDDREWSEAITEAKSWATGPQLRQLFVTMLLFCEVSSPINLWNAHWEDFCEDILYRKRKLFMFPGLQLSDEQKKNYCLMDIQDLLHKNGKSLEDYPDLPKLDPALVTNDDNRLIREELTYNRMAEAAEHEQLYASLNSDQHSIYEQVLKSVHTKTGGFYFVYGPGGTGKTFLYKAIITRLRSEGLIVLAVASSGIAALLLPGGRTAHSRFVIPVELFETSTCGIKQNTHLAELMQQVKLIIWDEAPMCQRYAFEALDKSLKDILGYKDPTNRTRIFGGVTVLLGGDFRQILPVIPKGKRQEIVQACINKSELWKQCQMFTLTRSMRVNELTTSGDIDTRKQQFNKWVLDVGDGAVPAKAKPGEDEPTWIKIPQNFIIDYTTSPIDEIISETFPDFLERQDDEEYLRERAILTPKNDDADEINETMLNKLNRPGKTYKSSDEVCKASTDSTEQESLYPVEFLNTLTFPGMPPHELHVKEGLPVMLLRNVNPAQGLCNGTRLLITGLGRFIIKARIITGSKIGDTALIPRITLSSTKSKWPFILKRRQFPIKPCYAMTINKSQGQSLNFVGLYLPKPVFSHGQLYVALSRVTTPEGFKVLMIEDNDTNLKHHTRNIVYKEVFNNLFN
uniref:ATP-dependent DNA helicase PIF1-like n=1 Tax=Erigeron canadensis TaxID=72917 RepID=UPI001CB9CF23|nr:ATP-dependent DNA helicase PIF1-like [Erigeron canadensis]